MATQLQLQSIRGIDQKQQDSTQSRINQQMDVLTKAIEKILSLRQMTSTAQKQ